MLHQNQRRQIIHQRIEAHGCEGDGTDKAEKYAHGSQEPFIQHDPRKKEGRHDGFFFRRQFFGRNLPDPFDIHIHSFVEVNEDLIYFLMIPQEQIEKVGCGNAVLQFHGIGEAFCRQRTGGFCQLKQDICCGLGKEVFACVRRAHPLGMDGGHGHQQPVEPRQTGQIFQIKSGVCAQFFLKELLIFLQKQAVSVSGTVGCAEIDEGLQVFCQRVFFCGIPQQGEVVLGNKFLIGLFLRRFCPHHIGIFSCIVSLVPEIQIQNIGG